MTLRAIDNVIANLLSIFILAAGRRMRFSVLDVMRESAIGCLVMIAVIIVCGMLEGHFWLAIVVVPFCLFRKTVFTFIETISEASKHKNDQSIIDRFNHYSRLNKTRHILARVSATTILVGYILFEALHPTKIFEGLPALLALSTFVSLAYATRIEHFPVDTQREAG